MYSKNKAKILYVITVYWNVKKKTKTFEIVFSDKVIYITPTLYDVAIRRKD